MTAGTEPQSVRAKAPRWMKVLLVVSLAVNLAVAGAVGTAIWRFRHGGPLATAYAVSGPGNLIAFAASLPHGRRQEIWQRTTDERRLLRALRAELRAARLDVQTSLTADPFDVARFAAAQARLHETESRARAEAQKLVLAIVKMLDSTERAALARWQATEGPRGRGPWRAWRRPPPADAGVPPEPPPAPVEK